MNFEETENHKGRDWALVNAMSNYARKTPQKNLTPILINKVTRKTKLALVLLPEWSVYLPPYNLSRLSAVTRAAGFHTTVFDFNIDLYHKLKNNLDTNLWETKNEWQWTKNYYFEYIHPHIENFLDDYIQKFIELNPDVIGFTMYNTNEYLTNFMALKLRKVLPYCKIIVGGPNIESMNKLSKNFYHHVVEGEGEQIIIDILEKIEKNEPIETHFFAKNMKVRIDLDSLPFPDYSDYDLQKYLIPNGVPAEISRGCVAKCVFCAEVHFWKYRGRMSNSLLNEIEYQYKTYNTKNFWFIDSLVNGNIKELKAFALGIIEKKLKIKWQGYARCDERMDLDYIKLLRKSGCFILSFGVESGSQKVLDGMKKEISVNEIEQNLKDCSSVNILSIINLIVGFPSERFNEFDDSLTLLYRIRNYNLLSISLGVSYSLTAGDTVSADPQKFDIAKDQFLNFWTTYDLKNTKLHRLIRQKSFAIFLQNLNPKNHVGGLDWQILTTTYKISYNKENIKETIEREVFDYNIIKSDKGDFANSVMNEIWVLLRKFWLALGPFNIDIMFDPELDFQEFGHRLGCNYTANHKFTINEYGVWEAKFYYNFKQDVPSDYWGDNSFEYSWEGTGQW